jgi:hypothetical protein
VVLPIRPDYLRRFTEAAQQRNIEVGLLVRHAPFVSRIALYFDALIDACLLARCDLG